MYISAISPNRNYNNYSEKPKSINSQSFKGINSEEAADRIFNIIKPKISSIRVCSSIQEIGPIINELTIKWNKLNPHCSSLKIVGLQDKNIEEIVRKNTTDLGKIKHKCYCVVIGDNLSSIENWSRCFDAVAVLIPKL